MNDDVLTTLARVLQSVDEASTLPHHALVELGSMGLDGELAVRFDTALGHPLVVYTPARGRPAWWKRLTPREQEVALRIAEGLSNAVIAKRLGIAVSTTKDHVHRILKKSNFRRRSQIAASLAD